MNVKKCLIFLWAIFCAALLSAQIQRVSLYDHNPDSPMGEPLFIPMGWSPEGYFALLDVREAQGRGGYVTSLTIVNCITDAILFRGEEWGEEPGVTPLGEVNLTSRAQWEKELASRGIEAAGTDYHRFPYERNGVVFRTDLDVVYSDKNEFYDTVAAYDLWIRGDDGTAKRVTGRKPTALDVFAGGYFRSPFEERIALVLLEERYTFEGTEYFPVIIGSHMAVGFEKD